MSEGHLSAEERDTVLRIAREGLEAAVRGRPERREAAEGRGPLGAPGACFVTLYEDGQLRGCIGALEARLPLAEQVRTMAAAAALRDPRFPPVQPHELGRIALSVSVLTPLCRVTAPSEVRVGEHGLVVTRGAHRGVLLPQVPVDHDWDQDTFLAQTCRKAGLPPDAWRDPATTLEVFRAELVSETKGV